jgi:hypothetical protein
VIDALWDLRALTDTRGWLWGIVFAPALILMFLPVLALAVTDVVRGTNRHPPSPVRGAWQAGLVLGVALLVWVIARS